MDDATAKPGQTNRAVSFLVCMTICYLVAFLGSQGAFRGLQDWYPAIAKPAFTPPAWIFAPVWSVLYFFMGLALWQVWQAPASKARAWGLVAFGGQLALNGLWSWIFFAWHKPNVAFYEIVALDLAILVTILLFNKVRSKSAWLMVPYLAWCLFATLLTFAIWRLNPTSSNPSDEQIHVTVGDDSINESLPTR